MTNNTDNKDSNTDNNIDDNIENKELDTAFDVVTEDGSAPVSDNISGDETKTHSDDADDNGESDTIFDDVTAENEADPIFDETAENEAASSEAVTSDSAVIFHGIDPSIKAETVSKKSETKRTRKKHKALKIVMAVLGAIVICTYITVSIWFMFHYNYKTYINGIDYSFYSLDDVDAYIESYIQDYSLNLKMRGGEEYVIKPEQISLDIKPNITAKKIIKEQNGFLWPYYMCIKKDYDLYYSASYNKDTLADLLHSFDSLKESNMSKPTDAYVTIDKGQATIIPETEGNYLDFDKLCSIIDEAIVKGESILDVSETDAYLKPELTSESEEIIKEQKELSKILDMTITYEIDQISWTLTSDEYGDWISNDNGKWTFSEDKVRGYVQDIASKYDTYGVPRNFRTHDDRVITLADSWYGWMIDVSGETEELMELLEAGESVKHTPPFDCYAAVYHDGGDDIGDSYIECDFGQQHVYAYIDGELVWDSECVSGSLANNNKYRTPEGVYTILYTKSPATLIGEDYETPVKYWMPFIGELGIGFHDASWRSSFGGDIYKSSGSHGCVNLPVSAAEKLFNIAYDGMPVICYY